MKHFGLVAVAVFLAGCASPPMQSTFYADEVAFIHERDTNTLTGNAFLRQKGGDVVSCAGSEVRLVPRGAYATERMEKLYDTASTKGFNESPFLWRRKLQAVEDYWYAQRSTTCDIDGRFEFKNVAAGSYFVVTSVSWTTYQVGEVFTIPTPQGGDLMAPVTFAFTGSHEVQNVVLTW